MLLYSRENLFFSCHKLCIFSEWYIRIDFKSINTNIMCWNFFHWFSFIGLFIGFAYKFGVFSAYNNLFWMTISNFEISILWQPLSNEFRTFVKCQMSTVSCFEVQKRFALTVFEEWFRNWLFQIRTQVDEHRFVHSDQSIDSSCECNRQH